MCLVEWGFKSADILHSAALGIITSCTFTVVLVTDMTNDIFDGDERRDGNFSKNYKVLQSDYVFIRIYFC